MKIKIMFQVKHLYYICFLYKNQQFLEFMVNLRTIYHTFQVVLKFHLANGHATVYLTSKHSFKKSCWNKYTHFYRNMKNVLKRDFQPRPIQNVHNVLNLTLGPKRLRTFLQLRTFFRRESLYEIVIFKLFLRFSYFFRIFFSLAAKLLRTLKK